MNVLNPSDRVTVNGGKFTVNIQNGMPVVYSPASMLLHMQDSMHVDTHDSDTDIL